APIGRNDINIQIAIVIAAEGDLRTVRREAWKRFFAFGRTESKGFAAALGDDPDITGINKGDLISRDVRITEHASIDAAGGSGLGISGIGSKGRDRNAQESKRANERESGIHFSGAQMITATAVGKSEFFRRARIRCELLKKEQLPPLGSFRTP